MWLFDARGTSKLYHHDQKSWHETLVWCLEMQSLSHIDPNGPELQPKDEYQCTPTTPSSHCYLPPTKKDGHPAYADYLLGTNIVTIFSSPEDQISYKAAIAKACAEKSTNQVVWEHSVVDGVYMYMDDYHMVSSTFP